MDVSNISIKLTKGLLVTMLLMRWDNPSEACPAFRRMRGLIALTCVHTYAYTVGTLSVVQNARGQEDLQ